MIGITNAGGAALGFRVVGGTTQPASPMENTIWINTSTAIGALTLSPVVPTNPAAGDVWIKTSTASNTPFNALKKDTLIVNPVECQQFVSGAWTVKTGKAYQNSAWADVRTLTTIYFDNGDVGVSGGYTATVGNLSNTGGVLYYNISQGTPGYVWAGNRIDLTSYNTMTVNCKCGGEALGAQLFGVGVSENQSGLSTVKYCQSATYTDVTVDVSALTGLHYVGFSLQSWSTSNSSQAYITSIIFS